MNVPMVGSMVMIRSCLRGFAVLFVATAVSLPARAAEHVILKNGYEMDCSRREVVGDKVRLYLTGASSSDSNYLEVTADAVVHVETVPDPPLPVLQPAVVSAAPAAVPAVLTREEMHTILAHAGVDHNIDEDLLASLIRAESGGQVRAISRVGARGLMQLMPKTADELGVKDAFRPDENIAGGSTYLDQLLTRYHDNVALALAAYNAGPAAVDKYHGVPPYRETRAYVARVIREFNRRKQQAARASVQVAQAR